jgi:hypothetical protein
VVDSRFAVLDLQFHSSLVCINTPHVRLRFMAQPFIPGDDLLFQLESGFGLLRIIAVEGEGPQTVWHLLAYEEFFPSGEAAEEALTNANSLHVRNPHLALTDRAFERTPAARLGNRPLTDAELAPYREWLGCEDRVVSDRSALLMLGIR